MRKFNDDEKQSLLTIIENKPEKDIYTGAYLLLDNQDAAAVHYMKMGAEAQAVFREYPIFHFWKKDRC